MLESSLVAFTSHDLVRSLGQSKPFCRGLLDILSMAGISSDHEVVQWAIDLGDASDASSLQIIIDSPTLKQLVLSLRGDDAVSFSDFLCNIIGKRALASHRSRSKLNRNRINYPFPDHRSFPHVLRRLLVALAEASEALPSGLFLQGVQALQNRDPLYGGGSSDIFKGNYGSAVVALKRLRFFELAPEDRPKVHKQFCRESLLWQMLEHPNILPFLGIDKETSQPHLCMVLPWMENGHILQYLKKNDIPPSSRLRAQLLLEVAEGLAYLHSENVVHGDMRANNILVDDQGHARITDFGLAVFAEVTRQSLSSDYRGSLRWLAPELVRSTGQQGAMAGQKVHRTRESDVWAYGCVFLEVYTGHPPFPEEKNDYQVVVQIALGARPTCPPCRTATDRHRWALVETCWHPQPSERPTMQAVIETLELDVVVYMDE
ncbi:hypothetical protein JAAARDRAFT_321639 [Jaapia argillacea MUCL 33604]|uniref:Protein kinase domain-containing protein n=1 Tax=Jaapia argillacea MUCL 33604 TaxID=933084 RepID=A0A067PMX1_9AGAM|nr:hypothetical protein JAAARDRAFT_321639 [Jaapia argillacea MUCL 33604]